MRSKAQASSLKAVLKKKGGDPPLKGNLTWGAPASGCLSASDFFVSFLSISKLVGPLWVVQSYPSTFSLCGKTLENSPRLWTRWNLKGRALEAESKAKRCLLKRVTPQRKCVFYVLFLYFFFFSAFKSGIGIGKKRLAQGEERGSMLPCEKRCFLSSYACWRGPKPLTSLKTSSIPLSLQLYRPLSQEFLFKACVGRELTQTHRSSVQHSFGESLQIIGVKHQHNSLRFHLETFPVGT